MRNAVEQQRELFAAVAAHAVGRAHVRGEEGAEAREDRVAERVSVRVVELLETIDVDHHDRSLPVRLAHPRLQLAMKRRAIQQAGETVAIEDGPQLPRALEPRLHGRDSLTGLL